MKKLALVALVAVVLCGPAYAQNDYNIPQASYDKLAKVFTRVRDNLWNCIDTYWHRGEYERDIAVLRVIVEVDPSDTQAYDDGAWLMRNQLRDDESEAFLLRGLNANPDVYNLYSALGYFYYEQEKPVESAICYERAIDLGAPEITWHSLAHSYEQAGYFYEAANIWLRLQYTEADSPVPRMQADRMLSGGRPSDIPGFMTRSMRERKKAAEERRTKQR